MERMMSNNQDLSDSIIRFETLSWKQIDELDRMKTLFFLPISPLEEHGPHLPVGTDLLTAQDASIQAIKQLQTKYPSYQFILLPAVPLGFAGFNTDFPGTVSVSSKVVKNVVYQYGKMLAEHGFSNLLVCSYHMALAHLKGIHQALSKLHENIR